MTLSKDKGLPGYRLGRAMPVTTSSRRVSGRHCLPASRFGRILDRLIGTLRRPTSGRDRQAKHSAEDAALYTTALPILAPAPSATASIPSPRRPLRPSRPVRQTITVRELVRGEVR